MISKNWHIINNNLSKILLDILEKAYVITNDPEDFVAFEEIKSCVHQVLDISPSKLAKELTKLGLQRKSKRIRHSKNNSKTLNVRIGINKN